MEMSTITELLDALVSAALSDGQRNWVGGYTDTVSARTALLAAVAELEKDAARVPGLLRELSAGEELMKRITDSTFLLGLRPAFNDIELANRWRMRVKLLKENPKLTLADAARQVTDTKTERAPCADGTCGKYRNMNGGCDLCGEPCL
jgi:hypothetical protein